MLVMIASIVATGQSFTCTPTHIWDGDGPIWCVEGPRIRLSGIAAREMDGSCRPNHPCPASSGTAARDYLVRLVGRPTGRSSHGHVLVRGRPLTCKSAGRGRGMRTAAWCQTPEGRDLSCAMLRSGTALRWARYDPDRKLVGCQPGRSSG
jgi:endonuclease YncB( thermonuclease family)